MDYTDTSVNLVPPSGIGVVKVSIGGGTHTVSVDPQGATGKNLAILHAAAKLVNDTFQLIH